MAKQKADKTRLERYLDRFKNHPVIAGLLVVVIAWIGLGTIAGSGNNILGFGGKLRRWWIGDIPSTSVTIPKGTTFKGAIDIIAGDQHVTVSIRSECPADLPKAVVLEGTIDGSDFADLATKLRYRLPPRFQELKYSVKPLVKGAAYEIACSS